MQLQPVMELQFRNSAVFGILKHPLAIIIMPMSTMARSCDPLQDSSYWCLNSLC